MGNLKKSIIELDEGIDFLQKLLNNKQEIIEGFKQMGLKEKRLDVLFDCYICDTYSFLEDTFSLPVFLLRNQIDEYKIEKRKYNILLEDSLVGKKDIFIEYINMFSKLVNDNGFDTGDEGYETYENLYDWLDLVGCYVLPGFKQVLKYGIYKEDDEFYYLDGYKEKITQSIPYVKSITGYNINTYNELIISGFKATQLSNLEAIILKTFKGNNYEIYESDIEISKNVESNIKSIRKKMRNNGICGIKIKGKSTKATGNNEKKYRLSFI